MYALLERPVDASRDFERAQNSLAQALPDSRTVPVVLAIAYMAIGDYDQALEALEDIAERLENGQRTPAMWVILLNQYEDPTLENPRFLEVRRRLGFTE